MRGNINDVWWEKKKFRGKKIDKQKIKYNHWKGKLDTRLEGLSKYRQAKIIQKIVRREKKKKKRKYRWYKRWKKYGNVSTKNEIH